MTGFISKNLTFKMIWSSRSVDCKYGCGDRGHTGNIVKKN